jgi:hypothetical protein
MEKIGRTKIVDLLKREDFGADGQCERLGTYSPW